MTTYFKVAPLVPDVLAEPPHSLSPLCVFKAFTHTHTTQIHKSHDVLNNTPDTYFIVQAKQKTHRTFDTRPHP